MTGQEIKELCRANGVTFIPHHACGICGERVGWYLFGRWPPYEVAFSSSCGCSSYDSARPDTWQEIADWVCNDDGQIKEEYKDLFKNCNMNKESEKASRLYDAIQEFISDKPECNGMTVEDFGYHLLDIAKG